MHLLPGVVISILMEDDKYVDVNNNIYLTVDCSYVFVSECVTVMADLLLPFTASTTTPLAKKEPWLWPPP